MVQQGSIELSSINTTSWSANILVQTSSKDSEINPSFDNDKSSVDGNKTDCCCKPFYQSIF